MKNSEESNTWPPYRLHGLFVNFYVKGYTSYLDLGVNSKSTGGKC